MEKLYSDFNQGSEFITGHEHSTNVHGFRRKRQLSFIRAGIANHVHFRDQQKLIQLIQELENQMDIARFKGLSPLEIQEIREASPIISEIRKLVKASGIAKMITAGDWIINRKKEIPESMSLVSFSKILQYIAEFCFEKRTYERTQNETDIEEPEFIAVDMGCGNGEFCENLRSDPSNPTVNKWEIYGYADCIYFTLNDFLKKLLNLTHKQDSDLLDFIDIISTLLLRKIHYSKTYTGLKTSQELMLENLTENLDLIREIFPRLEDFIELKNIESIHVDLEFLSDAIRQIPKKVLCLIKEYCDNPDLFINKYFTADLKDLTDYEKTRLYEIDREIFEIELQYEDRDSRNKITKSFRRMASQDLTDGILRVNQKKHQRLEELKLEKASILDKAGDLSKNISISPYNIIPGKFDEFKDFFPESSIHFAWSFRATSHLDDKTYYRTIYNAAQTLAPGGVFLDDGKRESWTRFERLEDLKSMEYALGPEYRIQIIQKGSHATAILIERGILQDIDTYMFFTDKYKDQILTNGADLIDIYDWENKLPQLFVRNRIIANIRSTLVKQSADGPSGRMNFRDIHPIIEQEINDVFDGKALQCLVDSELLIERGEIEQLAESIAERVKDIIRDQTHLSVRNLFLGESVPINPDLQIQTFPRAYVADLDSIMINVPRIFPISCLPRNKNVPSREVMSEKADVLMRMLINLKSKFGAKPIRIVKFDQCFTNRLLASAVRGLLEDSAFDYGVDLLDYIDVSHLKLQSGIYSRVKEATSPILIIGGSIDDAFDQGGQMFTNRICMKLLEEIDKGIQQRIIGICFGSQVLLQAYGKLRGRNFKTLPGALQYGAFPVAFSNEANLLQELAGQIYTLGMTRGSYSMTKGYETLGDDIKPLAFETTYDNGNLQRDVDSPPLGFSFMGGSVITAQFHPEIPLTNIKTADALEQWLIANHIKIRETYDDAFSLKTGSILQQPLDSPHYLFTQHFDVKAEGQNGPEPWVKNDAGTVFLLNALLNHARSLI